MKIRMPLLALLFLCLAVASQTARAVDITFTSSGTIQDGDSYARVTVQNDGTVVDMTGGEITFILSLFNRSTFNLTGGTVTAVLIDSLPSSTLNILGGSISGMLVPYGTSYTLITGGSVQCGLKVYGNSIIDVKGGKVWFSEFNHAGSYEIPPSFNIYGSNFDYTNGTISGYLLDGNPFRIDNIYGSDYAYFHLIPEPTALLFLTTGMLFLRKRKNGLYKIHGA